MGALARLDARMAVSRLPACCWRIGCFVAGLLPLQSERVCAGGLRIFYSLWVQSIGAIRLLLQPRPPSAAFPAAVLSCV